MVSLFSVRRLKPNEVHLMLKDETGLHCFDFDDETALILTGDLIRAFPAVSRNDFDDLISRLSPEQSSVSDDGLK